MFLLALTLLKIIKLPFPITLYYLILNGNKTGVNGCKKN